MPLIFTVYGFSFKPAGSPLIVGSNGVESLSFRYSYEKLSQTVFFVVESSPDFVTVV